MQLLPRLRLWVPPSFPSMSFVNIWKRYKVVVLLIITTWVIESFIIMDRLVILFVTNRIHLRYINAPESTLIPRYLGPLLPIAIPLVIEYVIDFCMLKTSLRWIINRSIVFSNLHYRTYHPFCMDISFKTAVYGCFPVSSISIMNGKFLCLYFHVLLSI